MPTDFTTFLDRDHDLPSDPPSEWAASARRIAGDFAFALLKTASFSVTTVLMALGIPIFAFLLLVGWDLNLALGQVDNFATRFIAADAARRLEFAGDLKILFGLATGIVGLARLPGFVGDLVKTLSREPKA